MDKELLGWTILLGIGFPLLVFLLNELAEQLEQRQPHLGAAIHKLTWFILPPLALLLVMRKLLEISSNKQSSQLVETFTWLAVVIAGIALINAVFTTSEKGSKSSNQWRLKVPNLFFQVIRGAVVAAIGFHIISGIWAVDLSGIVTAVGVSSLVVALALQDTLSNLVSGLLLLIAKPFKSGDWIEFNGIKGRVIEQNWWSVTLEHQGFEKTFSVPNGVLSKAIVENFGPNGFWCSLEVEFSYDDSPNRVLAALSTLNRDFKESGLNQLLYDPNVYVNIQRFGSSGITYQIRYKRVPDLGGYPFKSYFF